MDINLATPTLETTIYGAEAPVNNYWLLTLLFLEVLHWNDARWLRPDKLDLSQPPRFVHTSLTSTENWQDGKRAIDESADAAARVDVLISSPPVCLITVVSGLRLLNCIQDHHVSLWWCECGKQRENQSQGTPAFALPYKCANTHMHAWILLFSLSSVFSISYSLFSHSASPSHV